jgi:hypothetical protein
VDAKPTPADAATQGGGANDAVGDANDVEMCVICYDEPISVTLVHANETSHLCVCVGCSDILKANGAPCPACRAPIVVHLKNMYRMAQVMH